MTLNASMQSGMAGLSANASALSAISNNISNVNTTAYKRVRTDFSSLVTSTSQFGGYNSGGVTVTTRHMISSLGTLQKSGSGLDLGIDGQGFFLATQKSDATASDPHLFTRNGSFAPDKEGYLRNSAGLYLQGWPLDAGAKPNVSASDLSKLTPINIGKILSKIEPTTKAELSGNLKSTQPTSKGAAAYLADPSSKPLAAYDASVTPPTGTPPDYEATISVSDSKGGERKLTVSMIKLDADPKATPPVPANSWAFEIWSPDVKDPSVSPPTEASKNGIVTKGRMVFDSNGQLKDIVDGSGKSLGTGALNLDFNWNSSLGLSPQKVALTLGGKAGAFTQNSGAFSSQTSADGTPFSGLDDVKISDKGMVTAIFKNGTTREIAQIALATFVNADGLTPVSNNAYIASNESGAFTLKVPGENGAGLLGVGSLEGSDVDLSEEFTVLITTQRAYSANSKIITTADEMLQEILNLKR